MRITAVRAMLLKERVLWARPVEKIVSIASPRDCKAPAPSTPTPGSVLVQVEADDGLVGVGLGGGGWPGAFVVDKYLSPLLLGENPLDIERLWERMYRATLRYGQAGIAIMAISGIDLALWDLKGKALGQPVWQLLGGKARECVGVYATARDAAWARVQGFCGVKFGSPYGPADGCEGMRKNEAFIADVRAQVGPDMKLMIDCAGRWDVAYTLEMARILAPYRIAFIEEPVPPQDIAGYARLRRSIGSTLIAGGEHAYTRYAARQLLEQGALDIIQPDIRWTGGLSEMVKICDLAAAHNIPVMPHRGGMVWPLHLIMARAECSLAEGLVLTPQEADYSAFEGEPMPVDGYLSVSDAPGFGLSLRPGALDRLRGDL